MNLQCADVHHTFVHFFEHGCERDAENGSGLARIDNERTRLNDCDKRRHEKIADARMDSRKRPDELNAIGRYTNFFMQFSQRRSLRVVLILGIHRAAGQANLSSVVPQVRGAFNKNDTMRRFGKNRQNDRGQSRLRH
jgi:hypothetical protein